MYTDEFMEALALLYLHPADFCPLATRKSYICTRLVSLLVALDCNGHFEAVLESEGVMCWILWDCFGMLSNLSLAFQKLAQQKGAKRLWLTLQSSNQKQTLMYGILSYGSRNGYLTKEACLLLARPFFLVPTTSKRLLRRLGKRTIGVLSSKQPIHDPRLVPVLKVSVLDRGSWLCLCSCHYWLWTFMAKIMVLNRFSHPN